jgi:hypothetical protein
MTVTDHNSAVQLLSSQFSVTVILVIFKKRIFSNSLKILMGQLITGLKADDCNCNYGHPKMADVESGKNIFLSIKLFL